MRAPKMIEMPALPQHLGEFRIRTKWALVSGFQIDGDKRVGPVDDPEFIARVPRELPLAGTDCPYEKRHTVPLEIEVHDSAISHVFE